VTQLERIAAETIAAAEKAPADAVLRQHLSAKRLPPPDSARVAELVFTYFRWLGFVDSNADVSRRLAETQQLDQRFRSTPGSFTEAQLAQAVPTWVADEVTLSREWLAALQSRPALWLRAKRGSGTAVAKKLGACSRQEHLPDALEYRGDRDLFRTPEFHSGDFEVQDIASQLVSILCAPEPGDTWWDACAGQGGKMLHLSELMENKGLIWATDRSARRLAQLERRAARAKVFNYRAAAWDGSARLPTKTKFDGVLIDAPCSGVGTWQRNPHARWTTTRKDVEELAAIQKQLILHAAAAVKPGGRLIYAVCTITRSETDAVVDSCSPQLAGFEAWPLPALPGEQSAPASRKWIWPQQWRGNGMFVAAWRRLASTNP
jgi:16S rRNA (cytosine967-C5)-methyltransferase